MLSEPDRRPGSLDVVNVVGITTDVDSLRQVAFGVSNGTVEQRHSRFELQHVRHRRRSVGVPTVVENAVENLLCFAPLSESEVIEALKQVEFEEPVDLDRLARRSEGSPGQAFALADPEPFTFAKRMTKSL